MITEFIEKFTQESIGNIVQLRKEFFLVDKELDNLRKKINLDPSNIGVYLGRIKGKQFLPSMELIDIISKRSEKKIFVDEKGEWLFMCGRDLFGKSITKTNKKKGLILVQNKDNKNLGYGKIIDKIEDNDKVVVKNLLDKGEYLRMEFT